MRALFAPLLLDDETDRIGGRDDAGRGRPDPAFRSVSRYVPELKDLKVGIEKKDAGGTATLESVPAAREPTIQDLWRHTSGIAYDFFGNSLVKQEYRKIGVDGWDQTNHERHRVSDRSGQTSATGRIVCR